jgi:hypothetical protein
VTRPVAGHVAKDRTEDIMRVGRTDQETWIMLTEPEVHLLRHALERASFIDTPVSEQAAIAAFCTRALEALAKPSEDVKRP